MVIKIILILLFIIATLIVAKYLKNDKIKSKKILSKKVGIKSLGNVPYNSKNKNLLIDNNPKANIMCYIKDIRKNITDYSENQVFAFISCNKGEGKSWMANSIAVSLARINKNVLLFDSNLRRDSKKSQIFYSEDGEGLTDFIKDIKLGDKLENLQKARKYIKQTQIPYLHILQSGTISPESFQLINSKQFKEILSLLKEVYDYIIIDGTSFYRNLDCLNFSTIVDANILVVEKNRTKYREVQKLKEEIEDRNGNILGFILNKTSIKHGKYYGKRMKHRYGMYIENGKEIKDEKFYSFEELISPLKENLTKEEPKEYEVLANNIKDNFLTQEFINDMEISLNSKFNKIEEISKENTDYLIGIMIQHNKMLNTQMKKYNEKQDEEVKKYDEKTKEIMKIVENIQLEINSLNNRKDDEIKAIKEQINSINYFDEIDELKEKIDSLNYYEEIEKVKEKIDSLNYYEEIEKVKEKIDSIDYSEQIEEIKQLINNMDSDKKFEEIKEIVENIDYENQIKDIRNKIRKIEDKGFGENKRNNIINLGRFFMDNRKKDNDTFSINESISFYDLERLAYDTIYFDNQDNMGEIKAK